MMHRYNFNQIFDQNKATFVESVATEFFQNVDL